MSAIPQNATMQDSGPYLEAAESSARTEARIRAAWIAAARWCAIAAMVVADIVLIGWAFGVPALTRLLPGFAAMAQSTAIGFLAAGAALLFTVEGIDHTLLRVMAGRAGPALALAAAGVGAFVLWRHAVDGEIPPHGGDSPVAMMAPVTALGLTVLGLSLAGQSAGGQRPQLLAQAGLLAVVVMGMVPLAGYTYAVEVLYQVPGFRPMALHTATLFVVLGLGGLLARPDRHLTATLSSGHTGGRMARMLLPWVFMLPLVAGALILLGQSAGRYGTEFGLALMIVTMSALLVALIWTSARSLNATDTARERSDLAVLASEQRYRRLVRVLPVAIYTANQQGEITLCNDALSELQGRTVAIGEKSPRIEPSSCDTEGSRTGADGCSDSPMTVAAPRGDQTYRGEVSVERPDGSRRTALFYSHYLHGPAGEGPELLNILVDITDRKQAEQRIERLNRVYALLSGVNATIVRTHDRQRLIETVCRIAVETGRFPMACIGVIPPGCESFRHAASARRGEEHGATAESALEELALHWRDESAAALLQGGMPVIRNDIANDPRPMPRRAEALARGYRSSIDLPLVVAGRTVGIFLLYGGEPDVFDEAEVRLLMEMAGDVSFALDYIDKKEKAQYLAFYDQLTELPNLRLFEERLGQFLRSAKRGHSQVGLLVVDIARFKNINDTLGRRAGDELLRQVAQRLVNRGAEKENLARIGPDRFAAVIPGLRNPLDLMRTMQRWITQAFTEKFSVGNDQLSVRATGGIALFPADARDVHTLLQHAETALKTAKRRGEAWLFYTPAMNDTSSSAFTLENELRDALDNNEYLLHYQPKVDLAHGGVTGIEALLRWRSPRRGLVPPVAFIPVLEETGMILDVGRWVTEQAARDYRRWRSSGVAAPLVSVNVSPRQLRARDFVKQVEKATRSGGPPIPIDLEITESLLMENMEYSAHTLRALKLAGLACPGFG